MSDGEVKSDTEIEKLKQQLDSKTAAMNEFLHKIQDLDGEVKRLQSQRHKQDERIEALERRYRQQKATEAMLQRREHLAHLYVQLSANTVGDAGIALDILIGMLSGEERERAEKIAKKLRTLIFPDAPMHVVDFAVQLRKWSEDDEEFKKKLADMGFAEFEPIAVDLSKPLNYDED